MTSLFGGRKVSKDALRIDAYGAVDELNSMIGLIRSFKPHSSIDMVLHSIQNDLFVVGADLATPIGIKKLTVMRIQKSHVTALEKTIDSLDAKLPALKTFVLPGGSTNASLLHFARTICRRAERRIVQLSRKENIGESITSYMNRLSDLLFVLARYSNFIEQHDEILWTSSRKRRK